MWLRLRRMGRILEEFAWEAADGEVGLQVCSCSGVRSPGVPCPLQAEREAGWDGRVE